MGHIRSQTGNGSHNAVFVCEVDAFLAKGGEHSVLIGIHNIQQAGNGLQVFAILGDHIALPNHGTGLRHRAGLHAVQGGQRHQRRIQRIGGNLHHGGLVPHGIGVVPQASQLVFGAFLGHQLPVAGDRGVQNAFLHQAVEVFKIRLDIGAVPGAHHLVFHRIQGDHIGGQIKPLGDAGAERGGIDEHDLILLAVAIGVLFPEVPQHLGKLFQIGGFGNPQLVGPVAAVEHGEAAVGVGIVAVVLTRHIAEPINVAVLGSGERTHGGELFVKSLLGRALGIFVDDLVDGDDQALLRQSHQGGVVHGMGLGDVGQILAGGKPGLQDHRVLLRGNHFPVDVQLCIVQLAFQDLIGAVFLYLVPVVAGSPALGAQDLKFAEITGSLVAAALGIARIGFSAAAGQSTGSQAAHQKQGEHFSFFHCFPPICA